MPGTVASSLLLLSILVFESSAVQFDFKVAPPRVKTPSNSNNNLNNVFNVRYSTNITISGNVVTVLIDTGSTDLWVMPPQGLANFNDTGLSTTVHYGDGSTFVEGEIGVGAFSLDGGVTVPYQVFKLSHSIPSHPAYLYGTSEADFDSDLQQGLFGLLGLGFDVNGGSEIDITVRNKEGAEATWGQSVLSNIFAQNPDSSDFIGIALSRSGDQEGTADGSLTIGEYDPDYEGVQNSPKLLQTPAGSGVWGIAIDSFKVGGNQITWPSTLAAAPAGKNIVLLDTGTPNLLMPQAQINAIYSTIPGAVLTQDPNIPLGYFSESHNVWVVPCTAQINVVTTFATIRFIPSTSQTYKPSPPPDGTHKFTYCSNAITDIGLIGQGQTDALFGDSFLRNVYTAFDFGTGGPTKGTPFVQMLSTTDATKSAVDFLAVRTAVMKHAPPELNPIDLIRVFNGSLKAADAIPVSNGAPRMTFAPGIAVVLGGCLLSFGTLF
ncbi:Six-hairpin glycosidase [Mycena sanguinolenta]|uniref:Six-hairpin glycosidase n=1 Tax=Mycena sanguinolenta TaxID=230812 RepID=A0A8H6YVH6_9AGAR|nr:Six-hairpin glycosidase [Mycena sanguinolenta]